MESDDLRYLHFFGLAWAPSPEEPVEPPSPDADPWAEEVEEASDKIAKEQVIPPGEKLMAAFAEGMRALGWHCDYAWATYRGHAMDARRAKNRYDVEVWLVDAEEGRWELVAEPRRGLFRKIFQKKRDPDEEALLRLNLEEVVEKTRYITRVSPWRRVPYTD